MQPIEYQILSIILWSFLAVVLILGYKLGYKEGFGRGLQGLGIELEKEGSKATLEDFKEWLKKKGLMK